MRVVLSLQAYVYSTKNVSLQAYVYSTKHTSVLCFIAGLCVQ